MFTVDGEHFTSDYRLTEEEIKMRVLINASANNHSTFSVEQYLKLKAYLQSPLGAKVLKEIQDEAGVNRFKPRPEDSPSDQSVTGLRDSLITGSN